MSGWPRKAARWAALVVAVTLALGAVAGSLRARVEGAELVKIR